MKIDSNNSASSYARQSQGDTTGHGMAAHKSTAGSNANQDAVKGGLNQAVSPPSTSPTDRQTQTQPLTRHSMSTLDQIQRHKNASQAPGAATNGGIGGASDSHTLATNLVMNNALAGKQQQLSEQQQQIQDDINNGKDTTEHTIAAAKTYNDLYDILKQEKPNETQAKAISALEDSLKNAQPGDSLADVEKRAKVELTALDKKSSTDQYGAYGKAASTYARAVIFDEARFNNSKVLQNTALGQFQRPGTSVLDPLGPNTRLGILFGTRINAAASNFTKAGAQFMSGIQKMKDHKDPTDDFIGAGASLGQGTTELSAGAMTDFGNHMARLQAAKGPAAPPPPQRTATPSPERPGPSSEYTQFGTDDPLEQKIGTDESAAEAKFDQHVHDHEHDLEERVIKDIEGRPQDVSPLALQDSVQSIKGQYLEMRQLRDGLKESAKGAMKDAHDNIAAIDEKAQPLMDQLKAHGYDSLDAARASQESTVKELVGQLDEYGYLKQQAYTQFNNAMDEYEGIINKAPTAFGELSDILSTKSLDERPSAISEWAKKYGTEFGKYQNGLLAQTDQLPEWFKISKPLRAQLIPSAINTAFGAVGFGASLDNYLKKKAAGTLTTQDKLALAGQVTTLTGGLTGFIPVVGPLMSLALSTAGVVLSDMGDHFKEWQDQESLTAFQEQIRQEYNKRHPDKEIWDGFDGG